MGDFMDLIKQELTIDEIKLEYEEPAEMNVAQTIIDGSNSDFYVNIVKIEAGETVLQSDKGSYKPIKIEVAEESDSTKHKTNQLTEKPNDNFQTKRNLTKRMLTHKKANKMFQCNCCNYQTMWRSSLYRHMKTHKEPHEIQMFRCEHCPLQTIWRSNLVRHLLDQHSN